MAVPDNAAAAFNAAVARGESFFSALNNCAIVLEDRPSGVDARMPFQFFEPEIEEAYALNSYQEYAEKYMPQPGYAAYRGGNWSTMSLTLYFRADAFTARAIALGEVGVADVEGILVDMEKRVRWFEALGFPLRRTADAFANRQIARSQLTASQSLVAVQNTFRNLKRNDPPVFLVVFGSFLVIRGYLNNISLKWTPPFHPVSVRPYGCTVTMSLQRIDAEYPTWKSIRESAGKGEQSPLVVSGVVYLLNERRLADVRGQARRAASQQSNIFTGGS